MALLPRLESFIWGPNGQALTPDQVERLRERSESRLADAIDTSPVGHWTQGAARLVNALGGVMGERRANRAEQEGLEAAREKIRSNPALSGYFGGSPAVSALMGQGAPSLVSAPIDAAGIPDVSVPQVPIGPHSSDPRQDVSGAFAGSAAASGQNFPMSLVQSESGGNWSALNSEGYGGRLQFGKDRLADAARAGIIPAGMTGAQFSQLPPEAQQAVEQWHFADIDRQAERMGLNSYIGQTVAGIPITQDGIRAMAHLGGIGGAAKFLQSGGQYNPADSNGTSLADYALRHGGGSSAGITPIGGAGAPPATGVSPVIPALMEAMTDPWVQKEYGPVIQALMGQEMQRQNAAYEQQLRQQDPMYQAQLAKLTAPDPVDPWQGIQEINGQLVQMTPQGPQVIGDYRTQDQYRTIAGEQAAALGLDPANAYNVGPDGKITQIGGGQTINNILGGEELTPGQKKIDEAFADTYLNWTGGGFADTVKQIDQLNEAISILDKGGNVTGAVGMLPPSVQAFVNPDGTIAREAVEEVVQRSLREILGAQFTEKEGERLIARAYNPLLSPEENKKRVTRLLGQIKAMGEARQEMVDYFDENGTLRGYRGKRPSLSELAPLMDSEDADSSAPGDDLLKKYGLQ